MQHPSINIVESASCTSQKMKMMHKTKFMIVCSVEGHHYLSERFTVDRPKTGESENKYQNQAKGTFNGPCYCMKTRRRVLSSFKDYFQVLLLISEVMFTG